MPTHKSNKDAVRNVQLGEGEKAKVVLHTKHGQTYEHEGLVFSYPDPQTIALKSSVHELTRKYSVTTHVSLKQIEAVSVMISKAHEL